MTENIAPQQLSTIAWLRCVLPWPGKRKWEEVLVTKAMLLGADFTFAAVSAWDWDEAWCIDVGDDQIIASSSKAGCALAFLAFKGVKL